MYRTEMQCLDAPVTTPQERARQKYTFVKKLGSGSFSDVYFCIFKKAADRIVAKHLTEQNQGSQIKAVEGIQSRLVAVKIWSHCGIHDHTADSIDCEIDVLRKPGTINHPNIAQLIDTKDSSLSKRWYTMPMYAGLILKDFLLIHDSWPVETGAPPVAFAWHICAQVVAALLFLHHRIREDGTVIPRWSDLAHDDLHEANVLFKRLPRADSYAGEGLLYPDVVIADFGQAWQASALPGSSDHLCLLRRQQRDVQSFLMFTDCIARRGKDEDLTMAMAMLDRIESPKKGLARSDRVLRILKRFSTSCGDMAENLKQPLPKELAARFSKSAVTEAELEDTLPALAAPGKSKKISIGDEDYRGEKALTA